MVNQELCAWGQSCACLPGRAAGVWLGTGQHKHTSAAKNEDMRLGSGELHFPEKQPGLEKLASLLSKELFSPCPSKAREGFSLPSLCIQPLIASRRGGRVPGDTPSMPSGSLFPRADPLCISGESQPLVPGYSSAPCRALAAATKCDSHCQGFLLDKLQSEHVKTRLNMQ